VDSIKYVFGGALNVPNSVNLSFNGVDKCACIHLNEGEFIELFDEIYDNADRNKLTWNTGMEDFEPFVKSKFGAIIKS
jgi:hypothetical protein